MIFIFEDSSNAKYGRNRNKKVYNEKLVETPQEVVDEVIEVLDSYGFVLDPSFKVNPGKTWTGNVHMQVINIKDTVELDHNLHKYISRNMIDKLQEIEDKNKCPITWNFGLNKDGYITGGIDIREKYVEEKLKESFSQSINLDDIAQKVWERLQPEKVGEENWIDFYADEPRKMLGTNEQTMSFEAVGENKTLKGSFRTSHGRIEVAFRYGSEAMCDSIDDIVRFIYAEVNGKALDEDLNNTITRYAIEYYANDKDFRNITYVYADNKKDAVDKVRLKFGNNINIISIEEQEVPYKYKNWDLDESFENDYDIKFYQILKNPNKPTENGKLIAQRSTLKDAIEAGEELVGKDNFIIKAVCNNGSIKYVDNDVWEKGLNESVLNIKEWLQNIESATSEEELQMLRHRFETIDRTLNKSQSKLFWKAWFAKIADVRNKYKDEDLHLVSNRYSPDDPGFDEYDIDDTDFNDGEVEEGNTFIEDGIDFTWIKQESDIAHLDFDNWAVWSARESVDIRSFITKDENGKLVITDDGKKNYIKAIKESPISYFVVDVDTGFIDWGPVETLKEAKEFLDSKIEDYEND